MSCRFAEDLLFINWEEIQGRAGEKPADAEAYAGLVAWARKARGTNPRAFDGLTEWILDDAQWGENQLAENERILMRDVIGRFRDQNARLRAYLQEMDPPSVVNEAVFKALDRFDQELSGQPAAELLQENVARMFGDFSSMQERGLRQTIAGNKTGPTGTNSVEFFGYINFLKDCDAGVQWALFMPDVVKKQQRGFQVERFEYRKLPALRFIGFEDKAYEDVGQRVEKMRALDALEAYKCGFDYDLLFMHHHGLCVDVGPWHGVWGRFMKPDAPVPDGFISFEFLPEGTPEAGPPYVPHFAFAVFTGDMEAMHTREGYDSDAMYDVTRNIMLGEGVNIPYPDKYWTAEVFFNGCDQWSTGFLFSAGL